MGSVGKEDLIKGEKGRDVWRHLPRAQHWASFARGQRLVENECSLGARISLGVA